MAEDVCRFTPGCAQRGTHWCRGQAEGYHGVGVGAQLTAAKARIAELEKELAAEKSLRESFQKTAERVENFRKSWEERARQAEGDCRGLFGFVLQIGALLGAP